MSDWIEWEGGKRPISGGAIVEIKFRDGDELAEGLPANEYRWQHIGGTADIVPYKVVTPVEQEPLSATATQVGGDHYKSLKIQPMEYSMANNLNACQHTAIKYITRYKNKGGKQDIQKAIHTLQLLLEMEYPE